MNNRDFEYDGFSLPFSLEAEQSVLGAILLDFTCLDTISEILPKKDYFYTVNNKLIYGSILDMYAFGRKIDFVTVLEKLKLDGVLNDIEGKTYLLELVNMVPSISNAENYANIVKDKYELRLLIEASRQILNDATQGNTENNLLLDVAEQRIFNIRSEKSIKGLEKLKDVLKETFDRLDRLNSEDDEIKPISSGIGDLDRTLSGGLNRSDLILLAARPGMGKTSFALNIARNAAIKSKKKVVFFSLEMTKEQLASRILSSEAKVKGEKLRSGKLCDDEWARIIEASNSLSDAEIYLDDTPGMTTTEIKAKLRRIKRIDLVVIDYLQLMSSTKRVDNRVHEISEITRNLKIIAKEMNVPIVTLSQLSRASEQRSDHRPLLSDLRDSGSIEQDADIVMFLYRKAYYNDAIEDDDRNSSECIVAKNRHGEVKTIDLHWQGEFTKFTSISRHNYSETFS